MLKFVTTKPPRGRSPSGSGPSSHEASPSRTHYSPRFIRKHYSPSQSYGYPDNSRAPFPSSVPSSPSLGYRPLPSSSRGYFVTPSPPVIPRRRSEKSKHKRRFTAPDPRPFMPSEPQQQEFSRPAPTLYELQQQEWLQQQQQQQQPQQQQQGYPQQAQQQQHQQQQQSLQEEQQQQQNQAPWSYHNTKYSYKQATPSESSGNYATLQYKDPYAGYSSTSSLGRKFPLEVEGLYNAKGDIHQYSSIQQPSSVQQSSSAQQASSFQQSSSVQSSRKSSTQSAQQIPIQNVQQIPVQSAQQVEFPPSASESPYSTIGSRSSRQPLSERQVFSSSQPSQFSRSASESSFTSKGAPPPKETTNVPDNQLVIFGSTQRDQYPAETTEEVFPTGAIRTIKQQLPGGEFRKISTYQISPAVSVTPGYDVSRDMPDLNDPIIAKQISEQLKGPSLAKQYGQPVTTQFIINETLTRKKDTTRQVPYGAQEAGGQLQLQQQQLPSTVQQQQSVQKQQQSQQNQQQQHQVFSVEPQPPQVASAVQQEVSFTEQQAPLSKSQKPQPPTPRFKQEQSATQAASYHSPPASRRIVEYMEKTTKEKKEAPPPVKPKPDRSKLKASQPQQHVTKTETQQVMTSCVPQVTNDLSNEALNKNQSSMRSAGMSSQTPSTMSSTMRDMLNKSQEQAQIEGALNLDVVYITERIISMTFPSEGHDTTYTFNLKEVVRMLKTKHGDNYLILNLSEKRQDLTKANPQVKEYGWPDHLAPPLERLCSLCKAIDSWLNADIRNVVVLHCKGGRSRIASVIAAYMHYSNICASADQALDRFAMKRFYDDKLGGLPLPSQRRYVRYFSGLLSGTIKINSNPLYLHHILIHGVPNFDTKGGCRPFIKVYQGMQPIFTSGVYNVTDNMQKVCISISPGIPLRGDILIKCYHKKTRSGQREVMWQCQFHTCAISDNNVVFSKQELDDAILDPRFPDNGKVEFVFGPSSDVLVSVSGFKSDVTVPVDDNEESLARSDSYENFHRALEALDGYQGHNASFNSHYTSSATTNNINNNISSSDVINPSYASQAHQQQNQSNSTLGRKTVQTLEERTQLDELLSDLLSEQAYVSPTQRSPRSFQTAVQSQQAPISPGSNIATSPTMSGAKTVTTTTRTFTSYSSSDAHRNPDKVLIQRAEVSYKVPGQGEVKDHYTIAADPTDVLQTSPPSRPPHSYHPKGVPTNAFSYTAGLSSTQQSSNTQRAEVVEHEVIRSAGGQNLQSPPSSRLPYRPDYEPHMDTNNSSHTYSSLDADSSSWLAAQQQKLKNFKEGRDSSGRTEQEKKLVNELRFAQNKYYTRREQNEEEERTMMDSYNRQALHNGPTSPERVTPSYAAPQRSQSSTAVDGPWPQDQYYNTAYSTASYMESRSYGDKRSNKPPPSPTMQRSIPSSAPVPVPARSSSKEYMRTRSNSSSTNWQQQQQGRPLQRQQSDTLYDRNIEPIQPRSYGSTHSTPPHSPRAISPAGPHSTTTYTTYRTIERERERREAADEMQRAKRVQQQQAPPPVQQPPPVINHHYITEVFVHRTDMNKDKTDSSTRLDELEKNLEAASQSIKASKSSQNYSQAAPPQPQQQIIEESMSQHSQSRQFHTYQDTKPEPPRVKEIEEDRIMLRPIGPGMQTLEPESAHQGTLGRPTTPGFPTGPATPPFPVSPRTPYQNAVGGGQIISPTGTLQHPQQQPQHQTIQYQQYQSQQYQTQSAYNDGQGHGTLHIDTSPKMLIAPRSPSAGSPPSPGNFNTLRQQLSSAHSMSGSVVSPGPHSMTGQSSPSVYFGLSRRGSLSSLADSDMVHTTPKFVKDTSKYWYKPNITREEAIQLLKDKQPGTFVIRDSNSFPGAFGLALKVATIPPNVQAKPSGDPQADLVRHFLIEPTPKGVRLRGCSNEPVFGSLAALVYQHSITPLALPCKLALPEGDAVDGLITPESPMSATELNSAATLLAQGAACNVIYINSVDMESLTGPQAVAKAVKMSFENLVQGRTTMVHFKVSNQGITLTDNNRKLFFRRHYPVTAVTYCGMDPQDRRWKREIDAPGVQGDARIFGFVARKQGSSNENSCHIFAELDPEQPASAIVNFVTKVMIGQSKVKS